MIIRFLILLFKKSLIIIAIKGIKRKIMKNEVKIKLVFGAICVWLAKPECGAKLLGWFAIPLMVVILGLASQGSLLQKVGVNKAYFDIAGQTVKPMLEGVEGSKIGIVGKVRPEVFTAKFWIDKPGIKDVSLPDGESIDVTVLTDVDYVVLIGNAKLTGASKSLEQGEGYAIVKIIR